MNRDNTWRWVVVVLIVAWAIYELVPLTSRNLIDEFDRRAVQKDERFSEILHQARQLAADEPGRDYGHLLTAIGTNDITPYFQSIKTQNREIPTRHILNRLQQDAAGSIKLGLDLRGGSSFVVGVDTTKAAGEGDEAVPGAVADQRREGLVERAIEVLRKRLDKMGVAEPIITSLGDNRILIQMPGLSEAERGSVRTQIQKAAFLELRIVHPQSREYIEQGLREVGYEVLVETREVEGQEFVTRYLVENKPSNGITGKYIRNSRVFVETVSNRPKIGFSLNSEGARLFAALTRENVGRQMAIVLDGEVYSAPEIIAPITGGQVEISGDFTYKEASDLANILANPLETPVSILSEDTVGPSLGKVSIESGVRAAIIGMILVSAFLLAYYLLAGLVANVALLLNIIVLLGVLASIGATLTLPGIAGIVLTIGMAVDANVLIFERIREELTAGKSLRGAVAAGYGKAFSTIFDSNITTLISAVILIWMGTGAVQGFGVTLAIGISVSMFTALVATRIIFDWLIDRGIVKSIPMLCFIRNTRLDFLKYAKPAFVLSWLLVVVGVGYGFYRGHGVLGVDFAGGDSLLLSYVERPTQEELTAVVRDLEGTGEPQFNFFDSRNELEVLIAFGSGDAVLERLRERFPEAGFEFQSVTKRGPSVSAGIQRSAVIATVLAMFGILFYVAMRYEFSFAVAAVVAIVHDVAMTMGWFFLSGRELSAPMVAAVLTIIGFSINDTIVIFDRIREDLKLGVRGTFREVINHALNKTLSRTIITSGTTLLATLSLYLFGGGVINDFAFTFLVGIITGTYSTIFIASALVLWWHKGERPKMATQVELAEPAVTARA